MGSSTSQDGDLTQILYDKDGNLAGTAGRYIVRADNQLLNISTNCTPVSADVGLSNAASCTGNYGQACVNMSLIIAFVLFNA